MMICYYGNIMSYQFFVKCTVPPILLDIVYEKVQVTEVLAVIGLGGLNWFGCDDFPNAVYVSQIFDGFILVRCTVR